MSVISQERKSHRIKFGTDGWRALIAQEFTYDNLNLLLAAFAKYFKDKYPTGTPVVIGYDARFLADNFANFAAQILSSYEIPVKIVESAVATPVIAHAAKEQKSCGAIMFTASHNPPEYMGIKYIPEYAGPATKEITDTILAYVDELAENVAEKVSGLAPGMALRNNSLNALFVGERVIKKIGEAGSIIEKFNPNPAYIRDLKKLINFDNLKKIIADKKSHGKKLRIVYDPLYGAGRGYANELLSEIGFELTTLHDYRDVLFGGGMPEPKEEFLGPLKQKVLEQNAIMGASNDGDADRFAFVGLNEYAEVEFFSANKVLPILLKYMVEEKNMHGIVARTLCTTHLLDDLAAKFGLEAMETPVGFKWLGEIMRENDVILAAEESGGMSILGHIPEKDGILAIMLVAEMLAVTGKTLAQLWNEVQDFVGKKYFYNRLDLHMDGKVKDAFVKTFKEDTPAEIAGLKVTRVDTTEGAKIYLADGSWLLARPSGTEAMCRVYIESNSLEALAKITAATEGILNTLSK